MTQTKDRSQHHSVSAKNSPFPEFIEGNGLIKKESIAIPTTQDYFVMPETGEIILPPRSDVPAEDLPPPDDIFFYGWREVDYWIDGIEVGARMPLTLEDVLHPQLGDYVLQNITHALLCGDLKDGLKSHIGHEPGTVILNDVGIDWGIPDFKVHSPDLAVIRGVQEFLKKGLFDLKRSKGYVVLVLEVTSPSTRKVDVEGEHNPNKVEEYAQAGAAIYILIDAANWEEGYPPPIIVYALGADGKYQEQTPDARGWYWIEPLQVWIGPHNDWVAWYDKNGIKLNTHIESEQARKREAEARKLAEDKVREEAEARKLAEEKSRLAEDKVRQAEERIRQLEALLATQEAE